MIQGELVGKRLQRKVWFRTWAAALNAAEAGREGTASVNDTYSFTLGRTHDGYCVVFIGVLTGAIVDFEDWTMRRSNADFSNTKGTSISALGPVQYANGDIEAG